jgi:hypothetical protein
LNGSKTVDPAIRRVSADRARSAPDSAGGWELEALLQRFDLALSGEGEMGPAEATAWGQFSR